MRMKPTITNLSEGALKSVKVHALRLLASRACRAIMSCCVHLLRLLRHNCHTFRGHKRSSSGKSNHRSFQAFDQIPEARITPSTAHYMGCMSQQMCDPVSVPLRLHMSEPDPMQLIFSSVTLQPAKRMQHVNKTTLESLSIFYSLGLVTVMQLLHLNCNPLHFSLPNTGTSTSKTAQKETGERNERHEG